MKLIDKQDLQKIKKKKICILSGTGDVLRKTEDDMLAENDTFETSKKLLDYLKNEGFENLEYFYATEDNLELLENIQADIFLNLAEGSREEFLNKVCHKLRKMNVVFTGSQEETNTATTNKFVSKEILVKNHIPTPQAHLLNPYEFDKIYQLNINYPSIVKPVFEDGSTGITQKSVVENIDSLCKQCKTMFQKYSEPVLIEEYVNGREFATTVIHTKEGIQVLPIAETIFNFKKTKSRKWSIYSYAAKWHHHSEEYLKTPVICPPKNLNQEHVSSISKNAIDVVKYFNILDYARIDFRFNETTGQSYVIDINSNPSLEINEFYSLYSSILESKNSMVDFVGAILLSSFTRFGQQI